MADETEKTGHTPGPWRQFAPEIGGEVDPFCRTIIGGDGIFSHARGFYLTGFMREDDARLIAAAPDMLRIMKEIANAKWIGAKEVTLWRKECKDIIDRVG